jgi:hypothetical protein
MMYFDSPTFKVYTTGNYPFLILEPMGNLSLAEYEAILSDNVVISALQHSGCKMVYLELNGIWTVGMDQQAWTVGAFQATLKAAGVTKMAIGLAAHVYPTFEMLASMYASQALIPTKYFPDLDQMVAFLR